MPIRIAEAEVPGSDGLAVHERLDPERCARRDADAAERQREDMVALADPVQRKRELGTRALGPDAPFVGMGPAVSKPAIVAQVGQLDDLSGPKVEAPFSRPVPGGPANQAAFAYERFPGRLVVDWNTPDGRTADARVGGRVAAIQMRQDICVPEDRPAVDEHESARMLSDLETGPLELDEPLEGFKGWIEPLRERRRLVVLSRGQRGVHERRINAEVDHEDIRGASELLHRAQVLQLGHLQRPLEAPLDRRSEHPLEDGVGAHVPDRRVGGRNGERVGDERQDVARVVRQLEGHPGGVRRHSRPRIVRNGGDQGGGEARSRPLADRHLLELDVGKAPSIPLTRQLGPIDFDDEPIEIVRDLPGPVVDGVLAVVVAVVPGEALAKALDRAAMEEHPPAQVRVDVIAEQHLLVEPIDRQEVLAKDQLEIAGRIEADPLVAHGRLVQSEARAEALDLRHRAERIAPRQPFPEPLGELESR